MVKSAVALGAFAGGALAASSAYGQCGGQGWSGDTSCVSGYTCKYVNDWYSQCLPGSGGGDTGSGGDDGGSDDGGDSGGDGSEDQGDGFEWFGINESVAEFGTAFPGTINKDYRFPDTEAIGTLISEGYNTFRVAFAMERMAQGSITAEFDADYLQGIKDVVDYVTSNGAYAVLDPHNYGRYNGAIITDVSSFGSFWTKLATEFADNSRVIFDTNNEYNSMDQGLVFDLNQAAIDAIRGAGATSQTIFVEGNSWSGAWTWTDVNDNLKDLSDPQDNMVYEMHQYLDSDGSGTHEECVSATIGSERVADATQWLRDNGKRGIIGETAGGPNSQCKQAITDLVDYLEGNSDVWTGMLWWAAGPWWADYMYSFEPPSGTAYQYYDSLLKQHTV